MPGIKRILVPTDFSPTAERAFRYATDIATKTGSSVVLYHVYKPVKSTLLDPVVDTIKTNQQAERNLAKRLVRLKKKVTGDSRELSVATVIGHAPLLDNILGFAEHENIDLIVMGTRGLTGLKKRLLGSNAANMVEKTDLPLLLVPDKFEWKEPEIIAFATDYQPTDKTALQMLLPLARLYHAVVTIVHIYNVYAREAEKEKNDFDTYTFAMQRTFSEFNLRFKLIDTSSIYETLESLHTVVPYDMLVMVRSKKSFYEKYFIGSFTQNMAYMTKYPLLIIP